MEAGGARLTPDELGALLVQSLEAEGLAVVLESELGDRPILLSANGNPLRVFLWNATPGGPPGVRAEDEYRVQTTRPESVPFLIEDGRRTLLLGYHGALAVFAAWDVRVHPDPSTSSSLQVPLATLEGAADSGFASNRRQLADGEEVVMAFPGEGLSTYLELLPSFQTAVLDVSDADIAETVTSGEEPAEEDLPQDKERRVAVHTVVRLVRDRRFRSRVIKAYGGRCAFCGLGLGLGDAAHIQAVSDGGPDTVANGLCACPTHHRAFDRGFILVDDDLQIRLNQSLFTELGLAKDQIEKLAGELLQKLEVPEDQPPAGNHLARHRAKWSSS